MYICLSLSIHLFKRIRYHILRGRKIYEPPRYMTINQAIEQLLEIEKNRKENGKLLEIVKTFYLSQLIHNDLDYSL